jgi:phosphatidate cytidylyltransferase
VNLHPVSLGIVSTVIAILAICPVVFLALDRRGKMSEKLRTDLWTRWRSWLVLAPFMLGPILLGRLPAVVAAAGLSVFAYREFARATGVFRFRVVSAVVALGLLLIGFATADHWYGLFVALPPLVVSLIVIAAMWGDEPKGYIQRVALGVFSFLLFGVCFGHFAYFANDRLGQPLMLAVLFCVQINDVFAYCSGKLFGRRKLCPNTSPNKTIGGALGATALTTIATGLIFHFILQGTALDRWWHLGALGLLLSLCGQWGDLVMSSIKRDLGVKDMAALIPGHGGLLDRFDSLLFVGPALFHYIAYFRGIGADATARIFTGH